MLSGEKILITGPAGRIAHGIARSLAADNEVWGIARFGDPAAREEVESIGVTTRSSISATPISASCRRLHVSAAPRRGLQRGLRARAAGERGGDGAAPVALPQAKAALVMSTVTVYKPHPDPWHAFREEDPIGDQLLPSRSRTRSRRSPRKPLRGTAPASSACRSRSPGWAAHTATGAACRCGTCRPSRRGKPVGSAAIPCPTAPSTTTTSPRRSSRCSRRRPFRPRS